MFLVYDGAGIMRNGEDTFTTIQRNPMQLFLYMSGDDQDTKRLGAAVHKAIAKDQMELFKRLDTFKERLRMPIEPDSIAVLLASSRAELQEMQPLRGLLTEVFVVLVIPDHKDSTIRLAHLLLPRFLSQIDDNFTDLGAVLKKMIRTPH